VVTAVCRTMTKKEIMSSITFWGKKGDTISYRTGWHQSDTIERNQALQSGSGTASGRKISTVTLTIWETGSSTARAVLTCLGALGRPGWWGPCHPYGPRGGVAVLLCTSESGNTHTLRSQSGSDMMWNYDLRNGA